MKLFLISQDENTSYDTYSDAIVAADTEDEARKIHPGGEYGNWDSPYGNDWCSSPKSVSVKYIGEAADDVESGVICASYHAG